MEFGFTGFRCRGPSFKSIRRSVLHRRLPPAGYCVTFRGRAYEESSSGDDAHGRLLTPPETAADEVIEKISDQGPRRSRQIGSPRYSDSSTRSLINDWYSTCVSCSIVRHVLPSAATIWARYLGAPGTLTLSATTIDPGCSQRWPRIRSRSGR